jgi:hypothetical protein
MPIKPDPTNGRWKKNVKRRRQQRKSLTKNGEGEKETHILPINKQIINLILVDLHIRKWHRNFLPALSFLWQCFLGENRLQCNTDKKGWAVSNTIRSAGAREGGRETYLDSPRDDPRIGFRALDGVGFAGGGYAVGEYRDGLHRKAASVSGAEGGSDEQGRT